MAKDLNRPALRVVVIMPVYNEEDIIVSSLRYLIDQGISVYLLENWSTDATYELASQFVGQGVLAIERFPEHGPPHYHNWKDMLTRIEQLPREIDADWLLLQGVDEIHVSPWSGVNLRDGLDRVDREGFNCIDHTVMTFHPVDNGFVPGTDFETYFRYFDFSDHPSHFLELNGWKNCRQDISLAESGGHEIRFAWRRVYPYKFLLKHYPVRSQEHGEKKILRERKPRWDPHEKSQGWHNQYDHIDQGHIFLRSPSDLTLFGEQSFVSKYFGQGPAIVDWAASGRNWARLPDPLTSELREKEKTIHSLMADAKESELERGILSSKLALKEAELQRITNTIGWRVLSLYGRIKYPYLLPIYRLLRHISRKPRLSSGQIDSTRNIEACER
jgi:hypothetical protein